MRELAYLRVVQLPLVQPQSPHGVTQSSEWGLGWTGCVVLRTNPDYHTTLCSRDHMPRRANQRLAHSL